MLQPGPIVDQSGTVLGEHRGIALHTVGQRRGLGVATGKPLFVTELVPRPNTVVVGRAEHLLKVACTIEDAAWIDGDLPTAPVRGMARIRYRAAEVPCTVTPSASAGELCVEFDQPQRAITPGQALVIYDGDYVLGGGTIRG